MTKKNIEEFIYKDWIEDFDGQDFHYVQMWLNENLPDGYFLDVHHDYDYTVGRLMRVREENDEEYAERLFKEQVAENEREQFKLLEALYLKHKIVLLKAKDIVLSDYLQKHKDNPNIGDMENLFTALAQTQLSGKSDSQVVRQLEECLERLENS